MTRKTYATSGANRTFYLLPKFKSGESELKHWSFDGKWPVRKDPVVEYLKKNQYVPSFFFVSPQYTKQ